MKRKIDRSPMNALILVCAATAASAPGCAADGADGGNTAPERRNEEATFDLQALRTVSAKASETRMDAELEQKLGDYLDAQSRSGRLVDASAMHVATLPHPFEAGKKLTFVWDGARYPTQLDIVRSRLGDTQVDTGVGVQWAEEDENAPPPAAQGASGFLGAVGSANMRKISAGCGTFYFTADYPHISDHKMDSCFEKWKSTVSGSRDWIYNRWMLWTPGKVSDSTTSRWTTDLTIRSRPWKGYESRLSGMVGWKPDVGDTTCSSTETVTLSAGPASLTIPIQMCSSEEVLVDTNKRLIGLDWDGSTSANQMRLDAAGAFVASSTSTTPIWADYNWATTHWCSLPWNFLCDPDFSVVQKDSGW